jgi:uncharacterized protein (TIGR03435 family)
LFTGFTAFGQPAAVQMEFEVASVKPNRSGSGSSPSQSGHGRISATNGSLQEYIRWAYGVQLYQVSGPDWLSSERYDIVAKAADGAPSDQTMPMLQKLLADRFKLTMHRVTKEIPVYELVAAKNGPKLKEVEAGGSKTNRGRGHIDAQRMSMKRLSELLALQMDRPVLDATGLKGVFDFTLDWTPDESPYAKAESAIDAPKSPSLLIALQEQLGLRLQARKAPIEILVVDHAEKVPTEN